MNTCLELRTQIIALLKFKSDEIKISFSLDSLFSFDFNFEMKKVLLVNLQPQINGKLTKFHHSSSESILIVQRDSLLGRRFGNFVAFFLRRANLSQLRIEMTKYLCVEEFFFYLHLSNVDFWHIE